MGDYSLTTGLLLRDFTVVILLALVLGLGIHEVIRRIRGAFPGDSPPKRSGIDASHFTVFDLLLCLFVVGVFLWPVFAIDTEVVQKMLNGDPGLPDGGEEGQGKGALSGLVTEVFFYGTFAMLIVAMIQWVGMRSASEVFGLKRLRFRWIALWTVVGGAAAAFLVNGVSESSGRMLEQVFGETKAQQAVETLLHAESPSFQLVLVFKAVILAPLFEELVFRGYFYGILKRFSEPMFAALVSGAIFGAIHLNAGALLPLWFFGILLSLAYEATRSLWVPIGIHALFNATTVGLIFYGKETGLFDEASPEPACCLLPLLPLCP